MNRLRNAFTLIEILIGILLSLILLGVSTSAFIQMRTMAQRVEARLALNSRAETIFIQLNQRLSVAQQHAAFVIDPRPASIGGSNQPALRLLFLRAKEDQNDWNWSIQGWDSDTTDLYWDLWEYRPDERRLYQSHSRPYWDFRAPNDNIAGLGANLKGKSFRNSPRPRRTLANPDWLSTMEDNQLFPMLPRTTPLSTSLVSSEDRGDWGILQEDLHLVCDGVKDLAWEAVSNDGTVRNFTAGTPATPWIANGVWMDGRSTDASNRQPGQSGWAYASTELPSRPRLLRLRLTLQRALSTDGPTTSGNTIDRTYSFSFQLPAISGN
jgi:hypothetical protein